GPSGSRRGPFRSPQGPPMSLAMVLTYQDIDQRRERVFDAIAGLPFIELLGGERMALAGYLFSEAPLLVGAVADALEDDPDLFADVPLDPADLLGRQRRARAW